MRKLTLWLLLLALLGVPLAGFAEIECICGLESCSCFIQEGDEGIAVEGVIDALAAQGYLHSSKFAAFNKDVQSAVIKLQQKFGLPETGMIDDDTLSCLLWGMTAEELDDDDPKLLATLVWVPTDGGKRAHLKEECSGMHAPRLMTLRNAVTLGIAPCGRCAKSLKLLLDSK